MINAFSAPVLAVAADAVRDLEGGDALSGLWTRESNKEILPGLSGSLN